MPVDPNSETIAAAEDEPRPRDREVVRERYEILGLLGSGGMGNVYKARDLVLDETVALKLMRSDVGASGGADERFLREVKLARRVTHPNVARVFDVDEVSGERVLSMEYVDGESLGARLRRGVPLVFDEILTVARGIAAGVGAAHEAGVVHRDLKPDNVLLAKDGRVVVTDFGIALAVADASRTVGIVGTPMYMSPEQVDERASVDHRADVYALGAVLFEMLTGSPPFQGDSAWAVASARLLEPPPDPRRVAPDVPAAIAELVLRCMAKDPAARPASMAQVDAALVAALASRSGAGQAWQVADAIGIRQADPAEKRVAVLPFANLGTQADEYVADGLTEDLIDALSVARGLRVRSRGVVMKHKGATRDPRDIGNELDVQAVVEGSVRRTPTGYRVQVRLGSVAHGFQLWARRFDVAEAELLTQNDVIAAAIAEALEVHLAPVERPAVDGRAVDLYLRAKASYHRSFSSNHGPSSAVPLFDELLRLTPDDPRALSGRAMAAMHQPFFSPDSMRVSIEAADRAVAIAPMLPDGHVARGNVMAFDARPLDAIAPLRRALRLAPNDAAAHEALGRVLQEVDGDGECVAHLELARAMEPGLEFSYVALALHWELRGDLARSNAVLQEARASGVDIEVPVGGRFILWRRDVSAARAMLAKLDPAKPHHQFVHGWLALVANGTPPSRNRMPVPPGVVQPGFMRLFFLESDAEMACVGGDTQAALAALTELDALGSGRRAWIERCAILAPARDLPEVAPIRARFAARADRVLEAYRAPLA